MAKSFVLLSLLALIGSAPTAAWADIYFCQDAATGRVVARNQPCDDGESVQDVMETASPPRIAPPPPTNTAVTAPGAASTTTPQASQGTGTSPAASVAPAPGAPAPLEITITSGVQGYQPIDNLRRVSAGSTPRIYMWVQATGLVSGREYAYTCRGRDAVDQEIWNFTQAFTPEAERWALWCFHDIDLDSQQEGIWRLSFQLGERIASKSLRVRR